MMDKLYFLPSLTLIHLLLLCFCFLSLVFFFPLIRFCYSHVLDLIFLILISFASFHYRLEKQERFPCIRITSTVFISFILVSCCFHHHTLIVLLFLSLNTSTSTTSAIIFRHSFPLLFFYYFYPACFLLNSLKCIV